MACQHRNKAEKFNPDDKCDYLVCEDCGATLAKVLSRADCNVDHSKYVGKCPYCHAALPGISK